MEIIIKESSPTRSVERALDILECFFSKDELILREIAERTNLSPSTVLRIIGTMEDKNFVKRDTKTKKYYLGSKINQLANRFQNTIYDDLKKTAYKYMLELNQKYNENVRLFVSDGNSKLCIEAVESSRELRQIVKVGDKREIINGAAGKILLTYMSKENKERFFHSDPFSEDVYSKIRETGYALSIEEREVGLVGIAAPVLEEKSKVVAAISLSGPTFRFLNEELQDKIRDTINAARKISEELAKLD